MEELFKIQKESIEFSVLKDEQYPEIGLLNLQGALFNETIDGFKEVMEKINEKEIHDLVIDFSGLKSISEKGWETIHKYFDEFDKKDRMFVITRMRPFIYDRFKSKNYDESIPYYRTYNKALNHIVPEDKMHKKDNPNNFDEIDKEDDFDTEQKKEQNEEFPLEESRKLNEELQKNEYEEEFEFEDENEILTEMQEDENIEKEKKNDHIKEYEDNLKSFIIKKLFEWKDKGFDVSKLEEMLKSNFDELKSKFGSFAKKINEVEQILNHLEELNYKKFKDKIYNIKQKALSIEKYEEVKKEYENLINKIDKQFKQYQEPVIDYTFDNFIKGSCNSNSFDMSKHIIDRLEKFRRPIYIFGPNGSGKTHLLNAIGNRLKQKENTDLFYINGNKFKILLNNYDKKNKMDDFRSQILYKDVVLIDDFHKICNSDEALFEFRIIYDSIKEEGLKLFLTSVKKPEDIDAISSDLESRLNDSIFLRLSNIDRDTFHNIIKIQFEDESIDLNNDILEFLYTKSNGDIRKAYGFVNTLKTFYEAKNEKITLEKVKNILGFKEETEDLYEGEETREIEKGYDMQKKKKKEESLEELDSKSFYEKENEEIEFPEKEKFENNEFEAENLDEKEAVMEEKIEELDEIKDNLKEDFDKIKEKKRDLDEEFEEIKKQVPEEKKESEEYEKKEMEDEIINEEYDEISFSEKNKLDENKEVEHTEENEKRESENFEEKETQKGSSESEIIQDEERKEEKEEKEEKISEIEDNKQQDYESEEKDYSEEINGKKSKEEKKIEKEDDTISYGIDENFDKNETIDEIEEEKQKKDKDKEKEKKDEKKDIFDEDDYDFDDDLFNVDEDDLDWEDEELDEDDEDDDFFS